MNWYFIRNVSFIFGIPITILILLIVVDKITSPKYLTEADLNKLNIVRYDLEFEDSVKKISANTLNRLWESEKFRYERCKWLSECTGLKLEVHGNICLANKNGKKFPITECE